VIFVVFTKLRMFNHNHRDFASGLSSVSFHSNVKFQSLNELRLVSFNGCEIAAHVSFIELSQTANNFTPEGSVLLNEISRS
jgi:hypothetical protein